MENLKVVVAVVAAQVRLEKITESSFVLHEVRDYDSQSQEWMSGAASAMISLASSMIMNRYTFPLMTRLKLSRRLLPLWEEFLL